MKSSIWLIKTSIQYCFRGIIWFIFILTLNTVLRVSINLVNRSMVNELISSAQQKSLSNLFILFVIIYLIIWLTKQAMGFAWVYGINCYRLDVDGFFHKLFLYRSYHTRQEQFFNTSFMDTYKFVSEHTNAISTFIQNILTLVFSSGGMIASSFTIFWMFEKRLILYCILLFIIYALTFKYISKKRYELEKKQVNDSRMADYYKSILIGKKHAKELRIMKFFNRIYDGWITLYKELIDARFRLDIKQINYSHIVDFIKLLLYISAVIVLLIGIYNDKYDIGTFLMLFSLISACNADIYNVTENIFKGSYVQNKFMKDYFEIVCPIDDKEIKKIITTNSVDGITSEKKESFESIELKNISYTYPNSTTKAVNDVSFKLEKGKIISILGYNGSGKTTLSKIILDGLTPTSGEIYFNGVNYRELTQEKILSYCGILSQEFPHFSISIRDTIALGDIDKFDDVDEIEKAYSFLKLHEIFQDLENKENSILGKVYDEQGVELSGGEWQKIMLASAYMGTPDLLILDEPTASIDALMESEMLHNLRTHLNGKTALLISHRIGFARLADEIIVMHQGRIAEQGSHEELLAIDGYYKKMFYEQKDLYENKLGGN